MDEFGDAMWMGHLVGYSLQMGCFVDGSCNYRMLCSLHSVGGCFVVEALCKDILWLTLRWGKFCGRGAPQGCYVVYTLVGTLRRGVL